MSQLTLNRFRGDTLFELVARLLVTVGGGVIGMAVWYVFYPPFKYTIQFNRLPSKVHI